MVFTILLVGLAVRDESVAWIVKSLVCCFDVDGALVVGVADEDDGGIVSNMRGLSDNCCYQLYLDY